MEAITRNDTTVNIIKSIDYLRKEKHIKTFYRENI